MTWEQLVLCATDTQPARAVPIGAKHGGAPVNCSYCCAIAFPFGWIVRGAYTAQETRSPLCLDCTIAEARDRRYPEGFDWVRDVVEP